MSKNAVMCFVCDFQKLR